jgi:hypothetical protein
LPRGGIGSQLHYVRTVLRIDAQTLDRRCAEGTPTRCLIMDEPDLSGCPSLARLTPFGATLKSNSARLGKI